MLEIFQTYCVGIGDYAFTYTEFREILRISEIRQSMNLRKVQFRN